MRHRSAIVAVLVSVMATAAPAAEKPAAEKKVYALSLAEYTDAALKRSIRAQSAEENLMSSKWGWIATRRALTWPNLTASGSKTKSVANDDEGRETTVRTDIAELSLKQSFLTDTAVSVNGTWQNSDTDTEELGILNRSNSRLSPTYTASVTQPLFLFTGNSSWRSWRVARLGWENDQAGFLTERLSIEFAARTLYYQLLLQQATADVERKKLESAQLVHKATQALVKAGKLARVELARADIRAQLDLRNIQNAETSLEKTQNEAKDFVALPAVAELRPTSPLQYEPFRLPLPRLLAAAAASSPELQIAKRGVELAQITLRIDKNGNRPEFAAVGDYALTRDRSAGGIAHDPTSWDATLNMSWSFFDATQTHLKVKQSEVSLHNAQRSFENTSRQLVVSVQNAYLEVKRTEEQIATFDVQRDIAQRNVHAIRLQYENGLTRLTDVFDAEKDQRDLELEYLKLLVDFNSARDQLKVLVGVDLATLEKGR